MISLLCTHSPDDLNLILRGEEALENCSKFSLNMFKLWLISIYNELTGGIAENEEEYKKEISIPTI